MNEQSVFALWPILAFLSIGGGIATMVFFAAIVTPTAFQSLGEEAAGPFVRALFPVYYLFFLILAGLATLFALLAQAEFAGRFPEVTLEELGLVEDDVSEGLHQNKNTLFLHLGRDAERWMCWRPVERYIKIQGMPRSRAAVCKTCRDSKDSNRQKAASEQLPAIALEDTAVPS